MNKEARKSKRVKELLYKLQANPDASNKSVIQEGIKSVEATLKEFYKFEDHLKNVLNQSDQDGPSDTEAYIEATIENLNERIDEARNRTDATKKRVIILWQTNIREKVEKVTEPLKHKNSWSATWDCFKNWEGLFLEMIQLLRMLR